MAKKKVAKAYIKDIRKKVQKNIETVLVLEETQKTDKKINKIINTTQLAIDYKKTKNNVKKEFKSLKKKYSKETTKFIKKHNSNLKKGLLYAGIFAALLLIFEIGILITRYALTDKIPLNTYIANNDVSLTTFEETEEILSNKIETFREYPFTVSVNNQYYELTFDELGADINISNSLKNIKPINQNYSQAELFKDLFTKKEIPIDFDFDEEAALKNLEEKVDFLKENKTRNASYSLDEAGNIIIIPEEEGISIDMHDFKKQLEVCINELSQKRITISYSKETPIITASLLEQEKDQLKSKLGEEITLKSFEGTWKFNPNDYIDSLVFKEEYDLTIEPFNLTLPIKPDENSIIEGNNIVSVAHEINLKIKPEKIDTYITEEIAQNINIDSESAKIYKDESGNVQFEGTATIGKKVSSQALISMIELSLNNDVKDLNIPVIEQRPDIDVSKDLQDEGIVKLIAVGHSRYAGSPSNRMHNISVGMNTLNGIMIGPGEVFSFAEHIGRVDGSTGYRPELVIKPEGTVPEYGGGLCQVSSTFYRAALWGGFEIVDRKPHSYAVSYYAQVGGWGLDATVYPPAVDFKFKNNTPNNILLQSYSDGVDAWVKVYGTDDGRKVEMEGPYVGNYRYPGGAVTVVSNSLAPGAQKWVEKSHTGFDATWYRHLMDSDGNYIKETVFTRYNAVPAKVLVGPDASPSTEALQENPL